VIPAFRISRRAAADIDAIWDYTASRWSVEQAEAYVRAIQAAIYDLASGKAAGAAFPMLKRDYARYLIGSHVIFYRRGPAARLEIVRILHQSMDFGRHL